MTYFARMLVVDKSSGFTDSEFLAAGLLALLVSFNLGDPEVSIFGAERIWKESDESLKKRAG